MYRSIRSEDTCVARRCPKNGSRWFFHRDSSSATVLLPLFLFRSSTSSTNSFAVTFWVSVEESPTEYSASFLRTNESASRLRRQREGVPRSPAADSIAHW